MMLRVFFLWLLALPALAQAPPLTLPPLAEAQLDAFEMVGRVNHAGFKIKGSCSGTLIAPDVVLTAAHCAARDPAQLTNRMFVAGWRRGDYVAARGTLRELRHPAYGLGGRHDPRFDLGLLILTEPITDVAPLPLADPAPGPVGILGYHRYVPHLLTGRLDCPVLTATDRTIRIGCPVVSGNSGGPVVQPDGAGGWAVVGVVSSRAGRQAAIATRLPDWVREVLAEHQAAQYRGATESD